MGTKQRVIDDVKFDCALVPTQLAATNATGPYFSTARMERACFVCTYGPMGTTATVKLEVFGASDYIGTGTTLIAGATATTNATEITHIAAMKKITLATFIATATITVTPYYNKVVGTAVTFTAHATVTTKSLRQFSISGADTADAVEFCACANDATYGTPGIYWYNTAGAITGQAIDDYTTFTITCSVDDATDTRIVPQGFLIVEVDKASVLATLPYIAAKVTTVVGTIVCACVLVRHGRYSPNVQQSDIAPVSVGA